MDSLFAPAGAVKASPLATYNLSGGVSIVGADQRPEPAGPQSWVPMDVFVVRATGCAMTEALQTCAPVLASYATTAPWNVQHSYLGLDPTLSSSAVTGTYNRPRCSAGAPVMRATGCGSACCFQRSVPVSAFTAYTVPLRSPKYAASRAPGWPVIAPTLIAVRTAAPAWNDQ